MIVIHSLRRLYSVKAVPPRIKARKTPHISFQELEIEDISGSKISDNFVKYSSVQDLDPCAIDTRAPVMKKMWSRELLSEYCKLNGLKRSGTKTEIISRIREFWGIPEGKNFCEKVVQLRPAEIFLVKGKNNKTLDAISGSSNARIVVDEAANVLRIRGELSGVLKAQKMIRELSKNVRTQSISCSDIPSFVDINQLIMFLRTSIGAFAVCDKRAKELLIAAENSAVLSLAVSAICSLIQKKPENEQIYFTLQSNRNDFSFYPCQDLTWPLYYKCRNTFRLAGLSEGRKDENEYSPENLISIEDGSQLDDLNKALNISSEEQGNVEITVKLGHVICLESALTESAITPRLNPSFAGFNFNNQAYAENLSVSELVKWNRENRPIFNLIPTQLALNELIRHNIISPDLKPFEIKCFYYENENETIRFNVHDEHADVEVERIASKSSILNLNTYGKRDVQFLTKSVDELSNKGISRFFIKRLNEGVKPYPTVEFEGKTFRRAKAEVKQIFPMVVSGGIKLIQCSSRQFFKFGESDTVAETMIVANGPSHLVLSDLDLLMKSVKIMAN